MNLPLVGKWNVQSSRRAAKVVLPAMSQISIEGTDGEYQKVSSSEGENAWKIRFTSDDENVIWGEIEAEGLEGQYGYVISVGGTADQKGILGIVYKVGATGDDDDPGTWEADESGGPPGT